jgi:hypothetical protein
MIAAIVPRQAARALYLRSNADAGALQSGTGFGKIISTGIAGHDAIFIQIAT